MCSVGNPLVSPEMSKEERRKRMWVGRFGAQMDQMGRVIRGLGWAWRFAEMDRRFRRLNTEVPA